MALPFIPDATCLYSQIPFNPPPLPQVAAAWAVQGVGAVVAAGAVIVAAWTAAGSLGLLAAPLQIALTWVFVAIAAGTVWPWRNHQRQAPPPAPVHRGIHKIGKGR